MNSSCMLLEKKAYVFEISGFLPLFTSLLGAQVACLPPIFFISLLLLSSFSSCASSHFPGITLVSPFPVFPHASTWLACSRSLRISHHPHHPLYNHHFTCYWHPSLTAWPLEMWWAGYPNTLVNNYQHMPMLCNNPEEWISWHGIP
jgi:hypothetical protein